MYEICDSAETTAHGVMARVRGDPPEGQFHPAQVDSRHAVVCYVKSIAFLDLPVHDSCVRIKCAVSSGVMIACAP